MRSLSDWFFREVNRENKARVGKKLFLFLLSFSILIQVFLYFLQAEREKEELEKHKYSRRQFRSAQ